ncbi:hypothetical protein WN944_029197 [Citrus x changshan-huyou]|uniref:Uncharacterized protein n=1 Tax=Citrus x changshan-huyou TaxID=2935761 RepID=A0AAP0LLW5_9ROSI
MFPVLHQKPAKQSAGLSSQAKQRKFMHIDWLLPSLLKKELISRMWFEWNEYCGYKNSQVETVDVNYCGDLFLGSQLLKEDGRVLYRM